jgi:hypothetical protein
VTVEEWLRLGVEEGHYSAPYCQTHATAPLTDEELDALEEGDDVCIHVVRLLPG